MTSTETRPAPAIVLVLATLALVRVVTPPPASAHPALRDFVQHRAVIAAGATHVDVSLELTFYEHVSAAERARMDADADGRVSAAEGRRYLASLAATFEDGVVLTVDGAPLDLAALDEPRLDLMDDARVGPHPHAVRLSYFARTPPTLRPPSVLELRDRLWSNTAALRSIEIGGTDAFRFSSMPIAEPGVWRARCDQAPKKARAR